MKGVNYQSKEVPSDYSCTRCHVTGVKLWREYNTIESELLCAKDAAADQKKNIDDMDATGRYTDAQGQKTDQIGWFVPAVPDEEDTGFWGYSSVPDAGVKWWRNLPNVNEGLELTIVKVLLEGFETINPFITDFPVAGPHIVVYHALNSTFTQMGKVFAGKVDEMVALGLEAQLEERKLREGFDYLKQYGYLTIEDGVFTPTDRYLRHFLP